MLEPRITAHNTTLSPAAEADLRERISWLERYYDRIMGFRVTIDVPQGRRQTDQSRYAVRLDVTVPGDKLVVTLQSREELATALDEAFRAMRRRLQDYARRQRGDVKQRAPSTTARVAEYFPTAGYGFLETPEGRRIYFDRAAVLDRGAGRLGLGAKVRFTESVGEQGPQASTVAVTAQRRKAKR